MMVWLEHPMCPCGPDHCHGFLRGGKLAHWNQATRDQRETQDLYLELEISAAVVYIISSPMAGFEPLWLGECICTFFLRVSTPNLYHRKAHPSPCPKTQSTTSIASFSTADTTFPPWNLFPPRSAYHLEPLLTTLILP